MADQTPPALAPFEARYDRIARRLEAAEKGDGSVRGEIREEIVGLFREVEVTLDEMASFKERIRPLVARYKALAAPAGERPTAGVAPARPQTDHLGSSTYMEKGWTAIAAGDHGRAVSELRRALELAPGDPAAESLLGWALMLLGQYDEALHTFQKVLSREPENAIAQVNLGYICLQKGIFGEAIEHLSRATREGADRKAVLYGHFYLGLVYSRRAMYADARAFFRRALELGPNLVEAYWELGLSHYLDGDEVGARKAWEEGFETNRFSPWGERCGEALQRVDAGEFVSPH